MSVKVDQLLVSELRSLLECGRVLDVPAGTGHLSRQLLAAGYEVTAADLFPEHVEGAAGKAVGVDMNEPLPFAAECFDAVVCQEGIEHLENPAAFLRELSRVLKQRGHLWITTPNFMDLSGRLAFFLSGMKSFQAGLPEEETTLWGRDATRVYHGHAFTLPFFQIRYLLRVQGFEDISLSGTGRSTLSTILYPLVRPFIGWWIRRAYRRLASRSNHRGRPATSPELVDELVRLARSRSLLCDRKIVVRARRAAAPIHNAAAPVDIG